MQIGHISRRDYPTGLIVDIHDYCNANCRICPYGELKNKLKQGKMEWSLYAKIVDDFSCLMKQYAFQGGMTYCNMGEPFIFNDLEIYTSYAQEKGVAVYLNTNASLMTPNKIDRLLASGFQGAFNISFHGASPQVYEYIMRIPIYDSLNNIEYLFKVYPKDKISFNVINYQWPKGEEEKIRKLFEKWDVPLHINYPISRANLVLKKNNHIRRLAGCGTDRVLYQMVVCHDGNVLLCCNDMARREIVGNLINNSIQEVWNGEIFQQRLSEIYLGKPFHPDMICHRCEEAVSFWSLRRLLKTLVPGKILTRIRSRKPTEWGLSRYIQN
jgi:MoaA/NifB/PqqE/SkfB family radical SAM enzyme